MATILIRRHDLQVFADHRWEPAVHRNRVNSSRAVEGTPEGVTVWEIRPNRDDFLLGIVHYLQSRRLPNSAVAADDADWRTIHELQPSDNTEGCGGTIPWEMPQTSDPIIATLECTIPEGDHE